LTPALEGGQEPEEEEQDKDVFDEEDSFTP